MPSKTTDVDGAAGMHHVAVKTQKRHFKEPPVVVKEIIAQSITTHAREARKTVNLQTSKSTSSAATPKKLGAPAVSRHHPLPKASVARTPVQQPTPRPPHRQTPQELEEEEFDETITQLAVVPSRETRQTRVQSSGSSKVTEAQGSGCKKESLGSIAAAQNALLESKLQRQAARQATNASSLSISESNGPGQSPWTAKAFGRPRRRAGRKKVEAPSAAKENVILFPCPPTPEIRKGRNKGLPSRKEAGKADATAGAPRPLTALALASSQATPAGKTKGHEKDLTPPTSRSSCVGTVLSPSVPSTAVKTPSIAKGTPQPHPTPSALPPAGRTRTGSTALKARKGLVKAQPQAYAQTRTPPNTDSGSTGKTGNGRQLRQRRKDDVEQCRDTQAASPVSRVLVPEENGKLTRAKAQENERANTLAKEREEEPNEEEHVFRERRNKTNRRKTILKLMKTIKVAPYVPSSSEEESEKDEEEEENVSLLKEDPKAYNDWIAHLPPAGRRTSKGLSVEDCLR